MNRFKFELKDHVLGRTHDSTRTMVEPTDIIEDKRQQLEETVSNLGNLKEKILKPSECGCTWLVMKQIM